MANSVNLTFSYYSTDFTRSYKFDDVPDEYLGGLKAGVKAINAAQENGDDTDLCAFFVSDNGELFKAISAAKIHTEDVQIINLAQ